MHCAKAEQCSGANLHRRKALAPSRLARGAFLISFVSLLSLASACVSSVDPVLGSATSTQSQSAISDVPLNVAAAPNAAGVIDTTSVPLTPQPPAPASTASGELASAEGAPATQQAIGADPAAQPMHATDTAAIAMPVDPTSAAVPLPLPAPRNESTAVTQAAALAYAEPAATPVADATELAAKPTNTAQLPAAAQGAAISTSNAPVDGSQPVVVAARQDSSPLQPGAKLKPVKKASLFEFLKQRQEQRDAAMKTAVAPTANEAPAGQPESQESATTASTVASLEPAAQERPVQGRTNREASAPSALPGVQSGAELFGITAEEEEEDIFEPFEVASAGSMARMSPKGILTQTDKVEVGCFGTQLVSVLKRIESHYRKPVVVTSGYRNPRANRRAGGARHSMHMQCKAADIQVEGVSKWDLAKYLRSVQGRGGVGTYCRTNSVHIDTGPERDWHYPCRRTKKRA